jgi:hypothetical protein
MDNKKSEANNLINSFIDLLNQAARYGDTSYFYNMTKMTLIPIELSLHVKAHSTYTVPIKELIPYFQERFPYCKITYEDSELRKGILIDWS